MDKKRISKFIYYPAHTTKKDWAKSGNAFGKIAMYKTQKDKNMLKLELYEDGKRVAFNYSTKDNIYETSKDLLSVFESDKGVVTYKS